MRWEELLMTAFNIGTAELIYFLMLFKTYDLIEFRALYKAKSSLKYCQFIRHWVPSVTVRVAHGEALGFPLPFSDHPPNKPFRRLNIKRRIYRISYSIRLATPSWRSVQSPVTPSPVRCSIPPLFCKFFVFFSLPFGSNTIFYAELSNARDLNKRTIVTRQRKRSTCYYFFFFF